MNPPDNYTSDPSENRGVTLLDRIYTFVVISVALFFLAMAFWPSGDGKKCMVEGVWSLLRNEAEAPISPEEIENIRQAINSPEAIHNAIQTVSPSVTDRNYSTWEQKVAESVVVAVEQNAGNQVNIRVRAGGDNEEFVKKLITTLKDQFRGQYQPPTNAGEVQAERERLKSDVVAALKALDDQQSVIEKFLTQQMQKAEQESRSQRTSAAPSLEAPTVTATAVPPITAPAAKQLASVEIANPAHTRIQEEIIELEAQAVLRGTPAGGPQAGSTINELRELLELTPPSIALKEGFVTNPYISEDNSQTIRNPYAGSITPTPTPVAPANTEDLRVAANTTFDAYAVEQSIRNGAEFKEMNQALAAAKTRHNAALDALANASQELAVPSIGVESQKPPTVISRFRSGLDRKWLWSFLLPACLAGLVAAIFCGRERVPNTFYSVNDTSTSLGLPIVGSVTTKQGPEIELPGYAQRSVVRWIRHAAEIVLVIALLIIIYALATFDGFSDRLTADPFSGMLTAIDHIKSFLSGQA